MSNLAIKESALARQVEVVEQRVKVHCPEYNESNTFWKKADIVNKNREQVMNRINRLNGQIQHVSQ